MAYFISMNALISLLVVLTLAGSIEGRFFDTRTPASQPSASARARAHRLLSEKFKSNLKHGKCPEPMTSCPIPEIVHHTRFHQSRTSHKKKSAWECVDLEQELTACGKCDNDCMRLPNVENVGCESGKCKICEQFPDNYFTASLILTVIHTVISHLQAWSFGIRRDGHSHWHNRNALSLSTSAPLSYRWDLKSSSIRDSFDFFFSSPSITVLFATLSSF
ncbi:hypothetical protein PSTG_14053 [Puccinia striiformis f. sp. tritici PST-78]|uniref:Protein CPL1-like domain-containing protein n=1 Tax=Puccinia striiformis f. sp. tritici PST-78 TaxID=1165861 RepID=A0A0L0V0M1_9BASI|nr:hypothetical protein PSTG_14053 [Puccinia striiformis f. sp. tritici PST-78]